jgi:hypothetical protein
MPKVFKVERDQLVINICLHPVRHPTAHCADASGLMPYRHFSEISLTNIERGRE